MKSRPAGYASFRAFIIGLTVVLGSGPRAWADAPAATTAGEEGNSLPQDGLFSSVKQSLKGSDQDEIRGHFDLGNAPNVHRYYCLVDRKSGAREPNGVLGDPVAQTDGTTGLKSNAVSLYTCRKAEERGLLVTSGYTLVGPAARTPLAPVPVAPPAAASAQPPAAPLRAITPLPPSIAEVSVDRIDVAGVVIGMSPDQVRAVLKAKGLADYKEWTETLSYLDAEKNESRPLVGGKFVSMIAAWTAPRTVAGGEGLEVDGEAYEVMFTPVPGKEQALAIVHSAGYSAAKAIHESALDSGLVRKYGGFSASAELPQAPTWRFRKSGAIEVGDSCKRRAVFGGLGTLSVESTPRENIALKRTPEEFQSEIERCGDVIVTADHSTVNGGALPADRLITRFTVTAYSPSLGLDGANSAARLIHSAAPGVNAPRAKDLSAPNL